MELRTEEQTAIGNTPESGNFSQKTPTRGLAAEISANVELHAACCILARTYIEDRPVMDCWDKLIDYCRVQQGHVDHEIFRVLYLNKKNVLIADEALNHGSVDACVLQVRVVAKRCVLLDASAVIIVHNHPSGNPIPSKADIEMTKRIKVALETLDIILHDHLIVSFSGCTSLKSLGML